MGPVCVCVNPRALTQHKPCWVLRPRRPSAQSSRCLRLWVEPESPLLQAGCPGQGQKWHWVPAAGIPLSIVIFSAFPTSQP